MAKGFKDVLGKFRPTERKLIKPVKQDEEMKKLEEQFSKEVSEKRAEELKRLKGRTKETRVFKFGELDDDVQEKVLEKERQAIAEFNDDFFAQDEGILFDEDEKKDGRDIGLKNLFPTTYDVASNRGTDFIQFELEIDDEKKFNKYLGLPKSLDDKVHTEFENDREGNNTRLVFRDNTGGNTEGTGGEIDISGEASSILEHYDEEGFDEDEKTFQKDDIPTVEEARNMVSAFDKFDDLMIDSLRHLTRNYEFQFEEESIKENLDANEREFTADGTPA